MEKILWRHTSWTVKNAEVWISSGHNNYIGSLYLDLIIFSKLRKESILIIYLGLLCAGKFSWKTTNSDLCRGMIEQYSERKTKQKKTQSDEVSAIIKKGKISNHNTLLNYVVFDILWDRAL